MDNPFLYNAGPPRPQAPPMDNPFLAQGAMGHGGPMPAHHHHHPQHQGVGHPGGVPNPFLQGSPAPAFPPASMAPHSQAHGPFGGHYGASPPVQGVQANPFADFAAPSPPVSHHSPFHPVTSYAPTHVPQHSQPTPPAPHQQHHHHQAYPQPSQNNVFVAHNTPSQKPDPPAKPSPFHEELIKAEPAKPPPEEYPPPPTEMELEQSTINQSDRDDEDLASTTKKMAVNDNPFLSGISTNEEDEAALPPPPEEETLSTGASLFGNDPEPAVLPPDIDQDTKVEPPNFEEPLIKVEPSEADTKEEESKSDVEQKKPLEPESPNAKPDANILDLTDNPFETKEEQERPETKEETEIVKDDAPVDPEKAAHEDSRDEKDEIDEKVKKDSEEEKEKKDQEEEEEDEEEDDDEDEEEEEDRPKPAMTTGDAIFSDLPTTDAKSTGASIFGLSEESGAGSTGANLFGVRAPQSTQPALGSMTGWDDAFDRKFDTAQETVVTTSLPGDPFDPFGGPGAGAGGSAANTFADNSFGTSSFNPPPSKASEIPKEKNPFLDTGDASGEEQEEILFDDDTSKPLEPFPRVHDQPDGWEMFVRHPAKKKLTAQRYWKKVYVRLILQGDTPCVQLFENKEAKDPFQELPLQAAYSLSEISHQVFDQYSKLFTLKLQYIFYKERAGIRPGQMSKMQKLTGKIGFLAKAVEDADYEGVKEFASDMKKLGVPLEHAPQISELLKIGSENFEDLKQFSICVEEKLFRMDVHRERALTYKTEEVQLTAVDEVFVEQDKTGHVIKQLCRVRVFFLSFLTGMPEVELGVNDLERMGLEVVGRHDILPVPTEQWIRYEDIEFHQIVDKKAFETNDHIIKFQPPDACYLEIMRFRVRPPKARELPMQARCSFEICGSKVVIRADMMIPYHHTKAWGQVPCEDVAMRIPLPECWIYQFRTEKHHMSLSQLATGNINLGTRMGSVKSAHRRAGKVKGLERFMGTLETHTQELMETSSGQAKYEHQHKAIVWRVPRLPKHGQGSYTNHEFVCRLNLTSFDQMPETFDKHFFVEFNQPATTVSHTVLRSVSILEGSGEPPEKFAKYLARHEYKLEIEFTEKEQNTYAAAATQKKVIMEKEAVEEKPQGDPDFPDENGERRFSDSDSD